MSQPNESRTDSRLVGTLQRLLSLPTSDLQGSLERASQYTAEALAADKVDAFLFDARTQSLIAVGSSDTDLAHQQHALGLNVFPLANGGPLAGVFRSGGVYVTGHADQNPDEPRGVVGALGVRSHVCVPLVIDGVTRGVFSVQSQTPEFFTSEDCRFIEVVARWVGVIARRAEVTEATAKVAIESGRQLAAEEIITVLAHDLGNYATAVRAHLHVIHARAVRDARAEDVSSAGAARQALDRILRMITELMDLRRLDGEVAYEFVPVDVAALARELSSALRTPTVEVEVSGPRSLYVHADPDRLAQALENIIANAVKHSPPGRSVLVTLESRMLSGAQQVTIDVSDRGPGVSNELLPTLFERFSREQGSSGLGLGLYMARKIVQAHGGTLDLDSTWTHGARFRIALPSGKSTSSVTADE